MKNLMEFGFIQGFHIYDSFVKYKYNHLYIYLSVYGSDR